MYLDYKVEIGNTGKVYATITSAVFVIQEGGLFEGRKKIKIALIKEEENKGKKEDKMIHVTYHAVRNAQGEYMGVLEYVQNIAPYVKNFESQPLKRELS